MIKKKLTGCMIIQEKGFDVLSYTYNEVDMTTRQVVAMNKTANVIIDEDEVSEIKTHIDAVELFCKGLLEQ